jgi:hypothetical protein
MQPIFKPVFKLDTAFGHCDELCIEAREADLIANVQYFRTNGTFHRSFGFTFVEAHSLYAEPMLPLSAAHCVDRLCEIVDSERLDRVKARSSAPPLAPFHHFAIYFTKCGFLEVLCHGITIGPETAGELGK